MVKVSPSLKKYLTLAAKAAGVFLLLLVVSFFLFRGMILHKAIEKASDGMMRRYHAKLLVEDARFEGITGVSLKGIQLIPESGDTLLQIGEFSLNVRLFYALVGQVRIGEVNLSNGYLRLTKHDGKRNFDAFLHNRVDSAAVETTSTATPDSYAELLYKLIRKVLNKIPAQAHASDFHVQIEDEAVNVSFGLNVLDFKEGQVMADMQVTSADSVQHWTLKGLAQPSSRQADLVFESADGGRVMIPYLNDRFHLLAGFGSARLKIDRIELESDELRIDGSASMQNFLVDHQKISSREVVVDALKFDYAWRVGSNYFELDSTSLITMNGFEVHPFVKLERSPDTVITMVVATDKVPAQKFIDALPEGLFSHIRGMEADGSFSYRLDFRYNENHPDELLFDSKLEKEQLHIRKYGSADLGKLNTDFVYVPMENGRPMRPILVGPGNPDYTPIDMISPYLKKCVLTTEDPSFYWHRGFVSEAFKQSIVKNIRTGKFKRGASTISMQLMKNVFLTREKTIARKLEEILLVYILENNSIASKDRMFEVYLNIIEWGPNVYGIGEAARYYFSKPASELTLSESMFLATIVPGPKHFMWRFSKDGKAKPYLERTYRYLANKMIIRELILPDDTMGLTHQINITGPARKLIYKADTLATDSLLEHELLDIENGNTEHE